MEHAVRARVTIGADRTVRLPDEIPRGEADIIVLFQAPVALLRRLAVEDPDVSAAVADVDRSIIWANLERLATTLSWWRFVDEPK